MIVAIYNIDHWSQNIDMLWTENWGLDNAVNFKTNTLTLF